MNDTRHSDHRVLMVQDDPAYCAFMPVLRLAARDADMSPTAYARLLLVQGLLRRGYLDEGDLR